MIGPSAAKLAPGITATGTKGGNAKLHGLNCVTPQTIAYAACQVSLELHRGSLLTKVQARFALSTIETWSVKDGSFDYKIFYARIIELFERFPNDSWTKETLAWWNKYQFFSVIGIHTDPLRQDGFWERVWQDRTSAR